LADQITVGLRVEVVVVLLWWLYQIEKVKRVGEVGRGRKPAAKVELGEMRVWLRVGCQGEREMLKEEMVVAAEEGEGVERREVRKRRRERGKERGGGERDMVAGSAGGVGRWVD
jgi:hypothetical protein